MSRTKKTVAAEIDFRDPAYYTNRELSWVEFDRRVLGEAKDPGNRLMERLKFLSIVSSNLDEFVMVRMGSLHDMVEAGLSSRDIAGMTPKEQLRAVTTEVQALVEDQYAIFNDMLLPALEKEKIVLIRSLSELTENEEQFCDAYFESNVYPVLTPMAVDSSRPFPLIRNRSLNIGALVKKKGGTGDQDFVTVQVPDVIPRLVELPRGAGGNRRLILLEQIILRNIQSLFLNYEIVTAHFYRITRNGDMTIDEDETEDLLKEIEKQVKMRQRGEAIRLEVDSGMDKNLMSMLQKELGIEKSEIFRVNGPLDLTVCMKLYGLEGCDRLRDPRHNPQPVPRLPEGCDIFAQIRKGDILMHHPYQSFEPVVDFIKQAAADPDVLAIKQTLYRVSGHSPIIAALAMAAENGKQVTVLVELKARFDEEHNIVWARMLEKAGCHVIYGLMGLKTHSKITLVVRKEEAGIRRYVHLGTGNYNDSTAKLYTDLGLLTCAEAIGEDATAVFNMLSGYSEPKLWNRLILAPLWMKERFLYLIGREKQHVQQGRRGLIKAKMNSLCDPDIIEALYQASAAGVEIHLVVRGICCLQTGIPGVSENIHVRSIVGTFLEHSRIFYFLNDENPEIFCGSADWMSRNLDRRVEIIFPIEDEKLRNEVLHVLDLELEDNRKAAELLPLGREYRKVPRGRKAVSSQEIFCREAEAAAKAAGKKSPQETRTFVPMTSEGADRR